MPATSMQKGLDTMLHVTQTMLPDEYPASPNTTLNQKGDMDNNSGSIYYDIPLDDDETAYDSYDDCDRIDAENQHNKVHSNKGDVIDRDYTNRERRDKPKPQGPIQFDDEDMEIIDYDSDLDWNNEPFDYTVPMDKPFIHERYNFETSANESTLGFDPKQLVDHTAASVSSVQRCLSQTAREFQPHLGRVARTGQAVANNIIANLKDRGRRRDATTTSKESQEARGTKYAGLDATKETRSRPLKTSTNHKKMRGNGCHNEAEYITWPVRKQNEAIVITSIYINYIFLLNAPT